MKYLINYFMINYFGNVSKCYCTVTIVQLTYNTETRLVYL